MKIFKQLQKETQYETKRAYNRYVNDLVTPETDRNPKKLYSFANSKRCDSRGASLLKKDGLSHSDALTKATILNDQFSNAFTKEDMSSLPTMCGNPSPKMNTFSIGRNGVLKLLQELTPKPKDQTPSHHASSRSAQQRYPQP